MVSKLMKWQVEELTSWRNDKLMKWQVDEITHWQNGKLKKLHIDKIADKIRTKWHVEKWQVLTQLCLSYVYEALLKNIFEKTF